MKFGAVAVAQALVQEAISPGQMAVDATAGQGRDTLFMARLVGVQGRVYAFDVQEEALAATGQNLSRQGLRERVHLIRDGHQYLERYLQEPVAAVMFNLGYLPGGDHDLTTRPDTTLVALRQALDLLQAGGVLTVVVYPGHPGGEEEALAVEEWCRQLPCHGYAVWRWHCLNPLGAPPRLVAVRKRP